MDKIWRKQGERREPDAVDGCTGKNDAAGGKAIEQTPDEGRADGDRKRCDRKGKGTSARDHPNAAVNGFKNTPKVNTSTDPKPTKTPQQAVIRTSARLVRILFVGRLRWGLRTAGVAIDCRSFCSCLMSRIAHGVYAACIDPPVIKVKQGANRDRIVNRLVGVARRMENFDIGRLC